MRWRTAIGIAALLGMAGCEAQSPCARIVEVKPQHATRVYVTYEDARGETLTRSVHYSQRFTCGDVQVDPRDYLRKDAAYGHHSGLSTRQP